MIRIARLVGESYDFEAGRELNKGFVLSNGISEIMVEATPAQIQAVLQLYGELAQEAAQHQQEGSQRVAGIQSAPVPQPPRSNGHVKAPVQSDTDEKEPGEEYVDAETGTPSV